MSAARRTVCAVAALLAVLAAPASAQLRAVDDRATGGPALLGDRVVLGHFEAGALAISSVPLAGGEPLALGTVPAAKDDAVALQAGPSGVAVLLRDSRSLAAAGRLYVAPEGGAFSPLATDVGDGPLAPYIPGLQMTSAGVVTLEGGAGAVLRSAPGRGREVALPPGTDPELVAFGGNLGVAPTPDGALVVFDLSNDAEVRQISLGRYDASTINGLAISPAGDVAATVPVGDGGDVLLWARAGAETVRVLARGREYSSVVTAAGQVAWVGGDGLREGARVSVIDATSRRVSFRGPPAFDIASLSFDGRNVAFRTTACTLAGPASPASSRHTLPPGRCQQSEAAANPTVPAIAGKTYRVRVACINAPDRRCRVHARLTVRGALAGKVDVRLPRGGARVVEIPLNSRGRAARPSRLRLSVSVSDPDGRTRSVYDE